MGYIINFMINKFWRPEDMNSSLLLISMQCIQSMMLLWQILLLSVCLSVQCWYYVKKNVRVVTLL